jgi:hypothetical protein
MTSLEGLFHNMHAIGCFDRRFAIKLYILLLSQIHRGCVSVLDRCPVAVAGAEESLWIAEVDQRTSGESYMFATQFGFPHRPFHEVDRFFMRAKKRTQWREFHANFVTTFGG